MTTLLWHLASRIFIFVLVGALLNMLSRKKGETIARHFIGLAIYVLIPLFALFSLWTSPVSFAASKNVVIIAAGVSLASALLAWLWTRRMKLAFREYCLPVIFMNSAYLAIPVNTLIWGSEGASYTIMYTLVNTVFIWTFGIWLVSRERSVAQIFEVPIVYTVALGLALNTLGVAPSPALARAGAVVSSITIPAMLLLVGYRLGQLKPHVFSYALAGVALRMGGGLVTALLLSFVIPVKGAALGVCLMTSSMPAAVNVYLLSERYKGNAEFAAASVFLGTLISLFSIPVLSYAIHALF